MLISRLIINFSLAIISVLPTVLLAQNTTNPEPFGLHSTDTQTHYELVIRLGQGGFNDNRSDIGKLGGGQISIDMRPRNSSFALSISSEYYTNSPDPTHSYEIPFLIATNILYYPPVLSFKKTEVFIGAGTGWLGVPDEQNNPNDTVIGTHYNLEAGMHYQAFHRFGFYAVAKYLSANKRVDNIQFIDFNETIGLVGLTYRFGL